MTLPAADDRNADEIAYWNGPGGQRWLNRQQALDALLAPIAEVLFDRAAPRVGEFSSPMLERARQLAPKGLPVDFALADATVYPFEPGRANLLCSRFGVMFFAAPMQSFANMRCGLRGGARLAFACWRELRENPWLLLPLQEAYRHVPRLPEVGPEDPGPFSFAAERRVCGILGRAGFRAIELEPIILSLDLANGRGLDAAVDAALNIGPVSRALDGQPPEQRAAAAESIRAALAQCQLGDTVPLPAAFWIVTATNP